MPIYRNDIIPLADIITPNQFEAEYVFSPTSSFTFCSSLFICVLSKKRCRFNS